MEGDVIRKEFQTSAPVIWLVTINDNMRWVQSMFDTAHELGSLLTIRNRFGLSISPTLIPDPSLLKNERKIYLNFVIIPSHP